MTNGQTCPPFFLILSKFFLQISGQENNLAIRDLILRILPMVSSILTIPLFAILSHRLFQNKNFTLISTAILSLNQAAINYAAEFKQYSTELFFATAGLLIFACVDIKKDSIKKLILNSIFFVLMPWFSYSSIIIMASGFLYLIYQSIREKSLKILYLIIPTIINLALFAYHYLNIKKSLYTLMRKYWQTTLPSFFSFDNFKELFVYKMQHIINFPYETLLYLFIGISIFILVSKKNTKNIILILLPILTTILLSFLKLYPYEQRLILFLLPCFALIYTQVSFLLNKDKKTNAIVCLICITLSAFAITKDIEKYKLITQYGRNFVEIIKKENIKDYILISNKHTEYYTKVDYKINLWKKFEKDKFKQDMKKYQNKTKYLLISHDTKNTSKFNKAIKEYVIENYKDAKVYTNPNKRKNYCLIKFK